ncbi:MAG: NAD(P)/FAD-dependent oxidoreductase [Bacteroidia bacterium]
MEHSANPDFNIIGAGLAGSLMAIYLAQKGYRVQVFERRADMRKGRAEAGRSINLALSARGIHALRETGLLDEVMAQAIPMYGRMIHDPEGGLTFQRYSKDPQECIYSVSRAGLNISLMNRAEAMEGVSFAFGHRCENIDTDTGTIRLTDMTTGREFDAPGLRTIACDGAFSAVRYALQRTPRFNLSQSYLDHGYKELTIPPDAAGGFQIEPHALHIWPRGQFMMIALPNPDHSFTCTLFAPYGGETGFDALQSPEAVGAFFERYFPDAVPLIPDLLTDFFANPTGSLLTIRCAPWVLGDRIALLGDAAHAIVPFFGQGMNAGFEDCTVLSECIDCHAPDWQQVFAAYQQSRKHNADAIADMALENYIEMRDTVADEAFLFRKQVEHAIEQQLEGYRSRYEMVSFTRIPYAEAYRRGEINQRILARLLDGLDHVEDLDLQLAQALIHAHLPPLAQER